MMKIKQGCTREQVHALIDEFDENKDGQIQMDEARRSNPPPTSHARMPRASGARVLQSRHSAMLTPPFPTDGGLATSRSSS